MSLFFRYAISTNDIPRIQNSKEMKELLGYIARHHEDLEKSFTDEQKEIFEKFHDCWSEYASLAEEAIFAYAFKLGGRLMLETLSGQRKN